VIIVYPASAGISIAALLLALGLAAARDRALLRGMGAVRSIEAVGPGEAVLVLADGRRARATLRGPRRVSRFWVSLPVLAPRPRTLFLTSDMLGAERFRLLRLWALWGRVPGVAPGQLNP
jgi:hypothetical protein